jgi:hypothetical protein
MWKEESFWEPLWKGFWDGLWAAAGFVCNVSIYKNSAGEDVKVDYVGEPPEYATGPMKFYGDIGVLADGDRNLGAGEWCVEFKMDSEYTQPSSSKLFGSKPKLGALSDFAIVPTSGKDFRLFLKDDTGAATAANNKIISTPSFEGLHTLKVCRTASGFLQTWWDGVKKLDVDISTSTAINISGFNAFSQGVDFRPFNAYVYYLNFDIYDYWPMVNRLPAQNDLTGNTIVGTVNGMVLAIEDFDPFGIYYPYEDAQGNPMAWPTSYLVEDRQLIDGTCVIIPAGQVPVVDPDIILVTDPDSITVTAPY